MKAVMLFLVLILASSSCSALDKITYWVNDEAGVINESYKSQIVSELEELKQNTSVEMAVATVNTTNGVPIEDYAINLAHNVLGDKNKDNGILILVAVSDRDWRIEIGYGIEPYINDALAGRIGRDLMVPYFKNGSYGKGILQGVKAIKAVLKNESGYELTASDTINEEQIQTIVSIAIFFAIMGIMFAVAAAKSKKKKEDNIFNGAMWAALLFGRGGSGGFSGGHSGGGFGGFGGGGFGGGGSGGHF
jgi:uncharacterized protein